MTASMTHEFLSNPYQAYTYAYPHKTAYRRQEPPIPLQTVWENEACDSLFLYLHIPFCEYRCGFCNLFTLAQPSADVPLVYLSKLEEHAKAFMKAVPHAKFSRLAIGGGTPTYLNHEELKRLIRIVTDVLGVDLHNVPVSCEASPSTLDREKVKLLCELGVDRLSMGIQSFNDKEVRAIGRPQRRDEVREALRLLSESSFSVRNLDLIYGAENQTLESWLDSVKQVVQYGAEELFLYPLYVRQLTGLGQRAARRDLSIDEFSKWNVFRLEAYEMAREYLLANGYSQISMRNFRLERHCGAAIEDVAPNYCCQLDGMVGLGCGARSYTRRLHYSNEYAVGSGAVKNILSSYLRRSFEELQCVDYGFQVDEREQRHRYLLMSLLQVAGVDRGAYKARFSTDVLTDFPQLALLSDLQLLEWTESRVALTSSGIALSDAIGPWLYSNNVKALSGDYQWS